MTGIASVAPSRTLAAIIAVDDRLPATLSSMPSWLCGGTHGLGHTAGRYPMIAGMLPAALSARIVKSYGRRSRYGLPPFGGGRVVRARVTREARDGEQDRHDDPRAVRRDRFVEAHSGQRVTCSVRSRERVAEVLRFAEVIVCPRASVLQRDADLRIFDIRQQILVERVEHQPVVADLIVEIGAIEGDTRHRIEVRFLAVRSGLDLTAGVAIRCRDARPLISWLSLAMRAL
ncbi:MAG: hypothetical protein WDN08_04695 [Rhizomicrobium sp.]